MKDENSLQSASENFLDAFQRFQAIHEAAMQEVFDRMKSGLSKTLSQYHTSNIFIKCPACGRNYCISDMEAMANDEFYSYYKKREGKKHEVQCGKIYSKESEEKLQWLVKDTTSPQCNHTFTLHEGIIEYKAQSGVEWFSRGPFTVVEEGVSNLVVGQSIQPQLQVEFSWIDYVTLYTNQVNKSTPRFHWRRVGKGNLFEILTSAENKDNLGEQIKINWQVVGLRKLSNNEKEQIEIEPWRGYLISSARKLLYEYDYKMSILESETAFELFLEKFIEDSWKCPHLKENKSYLRRTASFSIETNVRILLHEALGIPFVGSKVWKDWLWTKAFRNQIAHGNLLEETKFDNKLIGGKFKDSSEIARFCYRSIVRAIYFIRYWNE